jgi:uncharacterized protein (UPF0305 family)
MTSLSDDSVSARQQGASIAQKCRDLKQANNRGDLGTQIADLVLRYSPSDIQRMKMNFGNKIEELPQEYRDQLVRRINEHLLGTYQRIRLLQQQGVFGTMPELVTEQQNKYWDIACAQCRDTEEKDASSLRFLKYLISGFCMLVLREPGHPPGTPFPGGGSVQFIGGIYYCPVREKANDVDAALCPFCPALQTPDIGYLKPAVNPSERQKQEFIENCHKFHNFNG